MLIKVSFKQISLNVLFKSVDARGLSEFNGERVPHHRAVYRKGSHAVSLQSKTGNYFTKRDESTERRDLCGTYCVIRSVKYNGISSLCMH